ncbi:MAG: HNH endonuclease [Actinomycetota bacterium]|nr:HNH endonuclease [Actinomycetota bacterium]
MTVRQLIPKDLAEIAPGPELARVLAGLELPRLSGFDCVQVLKAQYRQANHERARVIAAMAEVGVCGPVPDEDLTRMAMPDEFSADEVRAALMLTRRAADAQFWLAHDLVTRLPQVHAAMLAGVLDEPRARVLSQWTLELSPEQARAVCEQLLARAPKLTTGQLIEQVKKLAIAVDPDWARRRYEQAVAERKVVGYRNGDGSANLSGYNLPLDRVAAASGRIDALAKAAKRAGDGRILDQIRADLFLGMTDGTYTGLDDAAIITLLTAAPAPNTDDSGPASGEGADDRSVPSNDVPVGLGSAGTGMELRVRLSTLLGHDQYPAELAGWGYLHAELARDLAATLGQASWHFAITDAHGQLTHCGITRARPTGTPACSAACRAIVELQVPAEALRALAADPTTLGGWADVVDDLISHLDHVNSSEGWYYADADAARRVPGAALRRYLEIRDRSCIMIGCRAPARSADKDHTLDHAKGGPTTGPNLADACRHDHRLKGEGGWTLHQPQQGVFCWTSRLGHIYQRRLPAIIEPLPDPIPRDRPPYPPVLPPDDDGEDAHIWDDPPPDPEPDPPPESDPDSDVPPF